MNRARRIRDALFAATGLYVSRNPRQKGALSFGDLVATAVAIKPLDLRILQVGAYDGVSFDPIFSAVSTTSAKLFLIEPNSAAIDRLRRAYSSTPNVTVVQAAVVEAGSPDTVTLYRFSDKLVKVYPDFGGTSSLFKKHLEDAFERNRHRFEKSIRVEDNIVTDQVKAIPASQLMRELSISDIDVLVIDAEGADWFVLEGFLNAGLRPSLIQFESRFLLPHQFEAALVRLHSMNYLLRDLPENTVAIRSIQQED